MGILYYVYKKDKDKEPRALLRNIFIYGCLASVSVLFFEEFLDNFFPIDMVSNTWQMFINVFLGIALVEEGMKMTGVLFIAMKNDEFDSHYDAIVYCVYSSLGFAFVENCLYVISTAITSAQTGEGGVLTVLIGRAIFSIPGHAMFGTIMGYFIGRAKCAKLTKKGSYAGNLLLGLLASMFVHTVYDWPLMMSGVYEIQGDMHSYFYIALFILSFIFSIIIALALINKTAKIKTDFFGREIVTNVYVSQNIRTVPAGTPSVVTVAKPAQPAPLLSNPAPGEQNSTASQMATSLHVINPISQTPITPTANPSQPENTNPQDTPTTSVTL